MARLKLLGPTVRARDMRSVRPVNFARSEKVADPYYSTREHREWAAAIIARSGGRCEDPDCTADHPPGQRLYADHILERRDRPDLALDPANGMARCASSHSRKTIAVKRERESRPVGALRPDWLRPSRVPLTIVCGPPASGKSTWVRNRAGPDDLVIDLDDIASRLSGLPPHAWGREWLDPALRERNALLGKLSWSRMPWRNAYFIVGEPMAERREWWDGKLKPRSIVVCETPASVCHDRIDADPERGPQRFEFIARVDAWWRVYARRASEMGIQTP